MRLPGGEIEEVVSKVEVRHIADRRPCSGLLYRGRDTQLEGHLYPEVVGEGGTARRRDQGVEVDKGEGGSDA